MRRQWCTVLFLAILATLALAACGNKNGDLVGAYHPTGEGANPQDTLTIYSDGKFHVVQQPNVVAGSQGLDAVGRWTMLQDGSAISIDVQGIPATFYVKGKGKLVSENNVTWLRE